MIFERKNVLAVFAGSHLPFMLRNDPFVCLSLSDKLLVFRVYTIVAKTISLSTLQHCSVLPLLHQSRFALGRAELDWRYSKSWVVRTNVVLFSRQFENLSSETPPSDQRYTMDFTMQPEIRTRSFHPYPKVRQR